MKFIVSASSLLKHLQQINGVINANTVLPILEDFLSTLKIKIKYSRNRSGNSNARSNGCGKQGEW